MKPVTPIQHETYKFIILFRIKNDLSPTIQEIADHFEINVSAAWKRVHQLEKKGKIKLWGGHRSITIC